MKTSIKLLLVLCLYSASIFSNQLLAQQAIDDTGFKSLGEIEQALSLTDISVNQDGVRVSVDLQIEFAFGSANIMPSAKQQIATLAEALSSDQIQHCTILLTGHTDAVGSGETNQTLSEVRANRLMTALVEEHGMSAKRLQAKGAGETQLIKGLSPNSGKHRRVEISILDPNSCKSQQGELTENEEGDLDISW